MPSTFDWSAGLFACFLLEKDHCKRALCCPVGLRDVARHSVWSCRVMSSPVPPRVRFLPCSVLPYPVASSLVKRSPVEARLAMRRRESEKPLLCVVRNEPQARTIRADQNDATVRLLLVAFDVIFDIDAIFVRHVVPFSLAALGNS